MNKYKVAVYAIAKNEEQFVERWVNSMKEADSIYVLDTGSTDKTVDKLKELGVNVESFEIIPWRFDVARNKSLDMVPSDYDICICTDLDEVFEKGWREKLEKAWSDNPTRARYNYNWRLDDKGNPLVNFYIEKIHTRNNYKWSHPVHEVLKYTGSDIERFVTIDEITVNHYPDFKKSRGSYLSLLELSVLEDPDDDRNMHYLGREYMYYGKWNESIDTLIKHINLPTAIWKDERAASMRFIGRCYSNLKRYDEAEMWYKKAIKEAPYLRDGYMEIAILYNNLNDYNKVIYYTNKALKIKVKEKTYINEQFSWDHTVYDLRGIAYFYTNKLRASLENINKALEISPENERLIKNKKMVEEKISIKKSL